MTDTTVPVKGTKWLLLSVGWAFVVLGALGLFLPILQGILFLLIGLIILSSEYVWAHQLLSRLKRHFPHVSQSGHEIAVKTAAWFHRLGLRSHVPDAGEGQKGAE